MLHLVCRPRWWGGWSRRLHYSLPLDVDEAVEYPRTTSQPMGKSEGKEGSPLSPLNQAGGTSYGSVPAAGTAWIIVFLGGGWWSALLSKGW